MESANAITSLQKSVIFNLSLSSKELFHSNFIYWICDNYKKEFGFILINHFDKDNILANTDIKNVKRENKNIDLKIEFDNLNIIIENKVKSSPNKDQLINYKKKVHNNDLCVLLTIIKPNFDLNLIGWNLLNYTTLSEILLKLCYVIQDQYHKSIIKDYVTVINNLSILGEKLIFDIKKDKYDFYNHDYEMFKKIRLHDLYIKHKYSQLANEIKLYFNEYIKNKEVLIDKRYSHPNDKHKIVINPNLVNGKGIINIDYSFEEKIIYGIMLDGQRYIHYIYGLDEIKDYKFEVANKLDNEKKWFQLEGDIYPKNGGYNKFGGKMIYKSVKINPTTPLKDLIELIYKDTLKMIRFENNLK